MACGICLTMRMFRGLKNQKSWLHLLTYFSINGAASQCHRARARRLVVAVLALNIGPFVYLVERHALSSPLLIQGCMSPNSFLQATSWPSCITGKCRRGSTDNFSRKDRLYSTLPANSVGRGVRGVSLARNEEITDWSDDEAVALNGDWVCCNISFLYSSPFVSILYLIEIVISFSFYFTYFF